MFLSSLDQSAKIMPIENSKARRNLKQRKYFKGLSEDQKNKIREKNRKCSRMRKAELLSKAEKIREQNRIRQLAANVHKHMPRNPMDYLLVAEHIYNNRHRYANCIETDETGNITQLLSVGEIEETEKKKSLEGSKEDVSKCKEVNKNLRTLSYLKKQNRRSDHQKLANALIKKYGTYRKISIAAGAPIKTVHSVCKPSVKKIHKSTEWAKQRKQEFVNFLMQDTISYSSACKRHAKKRFLHYTLDDLYEKYLE